MRGFIDNPNARALLEINLKLQQALENEARFASRHHKSLSVRCKMIRCLTILGMFAVLSITQPPPSKVLTIPETGPRWERGPLPATVRPARVLKPPLFSSGDSGARTEGFLDFAPNGPLKAVEIVFCTFDAATRLVHHWP